MEIIIPEYKAISWNKFYNGHHWAIKQRLVDEAHQHMMIALAGMEYEMITYPVDILTIAYLVRKIDADNVCDKILIDGLKGKVLAICAEEFRSHQQLSQRKIIPRVFGSRRAAQEKFSKNFRVFQRF